MENIIVSDRMKAVADMVNTGSRVCDIGCDHAFVSIYLIKNNTATSVIASDVRKGPVEIAARNVKAYGLDDRIQVRMADGLLGITPGEADTAIIAGMGGMLMIKILEQGQTVVNSLKQVVLQPQSDVPRVRHYIHDIGGHIVREKMIFEDGKYYNIIDVDLTCDCPESYEKEIYYTYGKLLIHGMDHIFQNYMKYLKEQKKNILDALALKNTDKSIERGRQVSEEIREIQEIEMSLNGSGYEMVD